MACEQTSSATSRPAINVMFLCDEWKSSRGGLSTFNREFAVNLAKTAGDRIKVHCYVSQSDELSREDARQHGVELITARSIPGSVDPLDWLKIPPPKLPNPDIVVGHGRKFGTPAYFIVQTAKCKWMHFVHVFCEDLGKFKVAQSPAVDPIEENEKKHKSEIELCKVADRVIAVGSRLQRKYSKCLPHVKVEIITPGIFEKFLNESSQLVKHNSVPDSDSVHNIFSVFMFGRANFEDLSLKGYDIVANAIVSLGKTFDLTFVGSSSGEHKNIEQWFIDHSSIRQNQITIRSYCNEQDELKMMFLESDVVAIPSRTEGFGLVALEAISADIPVLVAGESGMAEALLKVEGGQSVIVESNDTEGWARRIEQLSRQSPEERENSAKLLRKNYNQTYPWSNECQRFIWMIEGLVENSNALKLRIDVKTMTPAELNTQDKTPVSARELGGSQNYGHKEIPVSSGHTQSSCTGTSAQLPQAPMCPIFPTEGEVLRLIASNYLLNTPPKCKTDHDDFLAYMREMRVIITGVGIGSLLIAVKCDSLEILETLWEDFSSSHLGEVVQRCFVTEEILANLSLAELKLQTTITEEEYIACKMYFEKDPARDFSRIKTKGEERSLDSAKVTIEQVPSGRSIVVTGISYTTTRDAIELYFESPRRGGGPVETVKFIPKSGRAVVVFEDSKDMESVLARHEEEPHVLNQAQLSIRIYHGFLEGEAGDIPDDSSGLETTAVAVDPDVMEFVTTSAFCDELNNSLAAKKSKITWKPNNKMAVIVYQGGDDSDSWQSECIDEVQNYLGKFAKRDVQVNKDFWRAVKVQLSSIRACLGEDPPLVKTIDDLFAARIVSLSSVVKDYEEKLKSKLEEIYQEETRKTYLRKKVSGVPEERLILLKKIKFVEKLQEKSKELEIKLDTENEEICFEGPWLEFTEATLKFKKQMSDMVEKPLTLSDSILEVLGSDKGLKKVKSELEKNNVEAVFVIEKEARIVGTSAAHVDSAARLLNKLFLEEKVQVDDKSKCLLNSPKWLTLCDKLTTETAVLIHRNNWNDTYVAGFRDDVMEVMKKLNTFLESNCIRDERYVCSSQIVRKYLAELRHEDLRSIENQLKDFELKIKKGKGNDDFDISGNKEGLIRARRKLDTLIKDTASETFDVKQPGLRKFFESGKGDRLVKSVEKDHSCAIHVQKNFGQKRDDSQSQAAAVDSASSGSDDENSYEDEDDDDDDDHDDDDSAVSGSDASPLVMTQGHHKISWRPGNIETEKADVLVSSVGASYQAIVNSGVPPMAHPNIWDITVSPGSPLSKHVIHTRCCEWQGGQGEVFLRAIVGMCLQKGEMLGAKSIAFPVIGTGKLNFPRDAASRIMLEGAISFCQANPASSVQDIRFVVFQEDQALTAAFKREMDKLRAKHKIRPAYTMRGLFSSLPFKFKRRVLVLPGRVRIEVVQGDLCQETTDAIVTITSKDINMESAGALSKAVKQASGPQVEAEYNLLGQQSGGSAVITSGGNLPARHIIHMIPDSARKDHFQQCVERCLRLAETKGLQSISFPAIGTGAFGMSAVDSANLIFQALNNFSRSFKTVQKVRVVVFQPQMLQAFQQEQLRHSSYSSKGTASTIGKDCRFSVEVINGDLTQETTDAIMNINSTDMNMNNAGELSKAIANKSGPQVQQECSQLGKQSAGSAVMTSGGNLNVPRIIHIIPGSSDKQHLQQCLEEGLRIADANNLRSISIPSVGTGWYGLSAADSAQVTFQALNNFSGRCKSVCKVRVVVFQAQMMQEFLQEQQGKPVQDLDEEESNSSSDETDAGQPRMRVQSPIQRKSLGHSVRICVIGKKKAGVEKAVESLKEGFFEAYTTEKVESEVISQLSHKQIVSLRRKAEDCDVKLLVEAALNRIVVRGQPTDVSGMVGEIWKEISKRTRNTQEEEQAHLVARNVQWSYEIHGSKMVFGRKTNAKIETAWSKVERRVQVPLRGEQFILDLKAKTGRGQRTGEQITLTRKVKGAEEGIALPKHWDPMPSANVTVLSVELSPSSSEFQDVLRKVQATAGGELIHKIERIQNPHLYQSYMVRKQTMDKDLGGNSEWQLFHGTDAENVSHINIQGFNRSYSGAHGVTIGRGVHFARDAQYALRYPRRGVRTRHMYLARVLVGEYCVGKSSMIVPPPKNLSRPEILYESVVDNLGNPSLFVVFFDNQCYPEYLITID